MPKNSSARRRRRARRIAAEEGVKFREALRRGDERAAQTPTESWVGAGEMEIDGGLGYVRHGDAPELGDARADPAGADVV
uniref:hypothetical protein n=1 Tax=Nocardia gipuzkoensis TaxID=2749991 RepID=UPI002453CDD0